MKTIKSLLLQLKRIGPFHLLDESSHSKQVPAVQYFGLNIRSSQMNLHLAIDYQEIPSINLCKKKLRNDSLGILQNDNNKSLRSSLKPQVDDDPQMLPKKSRSR